MDVFLRYWHRSVFLDLLEVMFSVRVTMSSPGARRRHVYQRIDVRLKPWPSTRRGRNTRRGMQGGRKRKPGVSARIIDVWVCDVFFITWDVTTIYFTLLIGTVNIAQRLILGRHQF